MSPKIGFEDTFVLWSGESGRTPWSQDLSDKSPVDKHGREHRVVNGKIQLRDLHATMLHQLGIDPLKLTSRHLGRDYRLTGVHGEVVKEILV